LNFSQRHQQRRKEVQFLSVAQALHVKEIDLSSAIPVLGHRTWIRHLNVGFQNQIIKKRPDRPLNTIQIILSI